MTETLETFMKYVDISGECWVSRVKTKNMRTIKAFPGVGETHLHRISYALMQPEKYHRLASVTRTCQTPLCCNGMHYQHGVLNEGHPRQRGTL